jgi:hypothetical protein
MKNMAAGLRSWRTSQSMSESLGSDSDPRLRRDGLIEDGAQALLHLETGLRIGWFPEPEGECPPFTNPTIEALRGRNA